jgi:ParB family chromosome partitioning protein
MSNDTSELLKNRLKGIKKEIDNKEMKIEVADTTIVPSRNDISIDPTPQNEKNKQELISVHISNIKPNPFQPRKIFENIEELAENIKLNGLIQPPTVFKGLGENEYFLITGERRLRALRHLFDSGIDGYEFIKVILIDDLTDKEKKVLALIENVQREDMTIIDTANAYAQLSNDFSLSRIADETGMSKTSVHRFVKISKLPEKIKNLLNVSTLKSTNKFELLTDERIDSDFQLQLSKDILDNISFDKLVAKIKKHLENKKGEKVGEIVLTPLDKLKKPSEILSKIRYKQLDNFLKAEVDEAIEQIAFYQDKIKKIIM